MNANVKKIDGRKHYRIVLDTETCPVDRTSNEVSPMNMWVYDIGWAVVDKKGEVMEAFSFVNRDIFLNERVLMKSAYYANKIPQYWADIHAGTRVLANWNTIRNTLIACIEKYHVKEIYAHNARFDYGSLNNTARWLTKSKYRYFFPYDIKICDTLKMATDVIGTMPTYRKFCEKNGYMTKHRTPRPQLKAEILYRFISGNNDFVENHTGLEDVMIEKEIMAYCYRQHKKMRKYLFEN